VWQQAVGETEADAVAVVGTAPDRNKHGAEGRACATSRDTFEKKSLALMSKLLRMEERTSAEPSADGKNAKAPKRQKIFL